MKITLRKLKVPVAGAFALSAFWLAVSASGIAQVCSGPTLQKQAELSNYVVKRYHLGKTAQITLVDGLQANAACFWKLNYLVTPSQRQITLYLSPDGSYLAPVLFDLAIDPLEEDRARAETQAKALVAGNPPSVGSPKASVTIVEFSDFQCPYCKRLADLLKNDLTADDKKNVRLVFRQFPLPMHPWANKAAELTACSALQSDAIFWKVHDFLFDNQNTFTLANVRDNVTAFAVANTGVDKEMFEACLDKKLSAGGIAEDLGLGSKNGVNGTPTIFINGTRYDGAKNAAQLRAIITQVQKSQQADVAAVVTKGTTAQ